MRHQSVFKILGSQKGSALILALTAVALLALMASATMTVAGILSGEAQRNAQADVVKGFASMLETTVSHPNACLGAPHPAFQGLGFAAGGGPNSINKVCDATCLNQGSGTGQLNMRLDTPFSGNKIAQQNEVFTDQNIKVERLYLTGVSVDVATRRANGKLMAQLSTIEPEISFAPREVGQVYLLFDASWQMTGCNSSPSAQKMCEDMQCTYNAASPTQKCSCGFPPLDCWSGGQRQYIEGVTPAGNPLCETVRLSCADTHGPGFFFAGVDANGAPVCLAVEGGYGVTPTAPSCVADGGLSGVDHVFLNNSYNSTVWEGAEPNCCSGWGRATSPSCPGMNCSAIDVAVRCIANPTPPTVWTTANMTSCGLGMGAAGDACAPASSHLYPTSPDTVSNYCSCGNSLVGGGMTPSGQVSATSVYCGSDGKVMMRDNLFPAPCW